MGLSAGITGDILFPDFEGFASQRAENKAYEPEIGLDEDTVVEEDSAVHRDSPPESLVESYLERGLQASREGSIEDAIRYYNYGISLKPRPTLLSRFYSELAIVHYNTKDFELAITDYNEAIRLDPTNAYNYYWRGRARYELGQYLKSIVDFGGAMNLNATDPDFYYWRGRANKRVNNFEMADIDFRMALTYAQEREDSSLVDKILRELSFSQKN